MAHKPTMVGFDGTGYLQTRLSELNDARQKALEEKGLAPFLSLPVGDTTATIHLDVKPRLTPSGKNAYRVTVGSKEFDLPLTPQIERQMAALILARVHEKVKNPYTLIFTRTGTGKTDTRYSVRGA